jgi:uncharacterized protein
MRVVVTGATGMIGHSLVSALLARGEDVVALSRDAARGRRELDDRVEVHAWADPLAEPPPSDALAGADAVVHLIGEQVAQRWTDEAKESIRDSRVVSTRFLVQGLTSLSADVRPGVLVSQSATGFYGPRGPEPVTESTPAGEPTPAGDDFLAGVVVAWEREALAAASPDTGVRVVVTRTGVVLSPEGGALAKMLPFFRLGIGGPVAGGRQYVPWVHLDDVVGAMAFCLGNHDANGPVNLTAPTPVTNADLSRTLGRVLKRPAFLPVPALALKVLYGEMAQIVVTGQRAVPARLDELGYHFRYPELEPALRDVLDRPA